MTHLPTPTSPTHYFRTSCDTTNISIHLLYREQASPANRMLSNRFATDRYAPTNISGCAQPDESPPKMPASHRPMERLTADDYPDRYAPYPTDRPHSTFPQYDQHQEARRWTAGGDQSAVYREGGRVDKSSYPPGWYGHGCYERWDYAEWAAAQAAWQSAQQPQYAPPSRLGQYATANYWQPALTQWPAATSAQQAPRSNLVMGFFDPNVAPFVPQQPQQYAESRSVMEAERASVQEDFWAHNQARYGQSSTAQQRPSAHTSGFTAINAPQRAADLARALDVGKAHGGFTATPNRASERLQRQAAAQTVSATPASDQTSIIPSNATAWLPKRSHEQRVFLLPRPSPTVSYQWQAHNILVTLPAPRPLLVILDLNGSLLCRMNKTTSFVGRPNVDAFLQYLLGKHTVMVWSSARPDNVNGMCDRLFTPAQREQLAGIWTRDMLRLGPHYHARVQVYKQLSWVWDTPAIQATAPAIPAPPWGQSNTVLIDDTPEKAASEPFNLIEIDEFERRPDQMDKDVLGQVAGYLETLRLQENVSAYMRTSPFRYDLASDPVDWARLD